MGFMGFETKEQWEDAVRRLLEKDPVGFAAYQLLVEKMKAGATYDEAITAVFGVPVPELLF